MRRCSENDSKMQYATRCKKEEIFGRFWERKLHKFQTYVKSKSICLFRKYKLQYLQVSRFIVFRDDLHFVIYFKFTTMEKLFECDRLRRDTLNEWLYMCLHGSTTDIQEVAHQSNYQTVMIIFLRAKKAWSIWNSVHKWEMFARKKNYFHFSTLHFIYQWQLKSSCVRTVTLKCWFCIVPCTNAIATRGVASNFAYQIVY